MKNPVLYPLWKELYDMYKDVDYGSLITYKSLNDCIGIDVLKHRYIVDRFKKEMLRSSDRALECVRQKGYRIVQPNEHGRLVCREIKRAERRTRQGVEYALHVPFEMLDDRERAQLTLIANRIQNVHASLVGESKSVRATVIQFDLPSMPRPQISR